MNLDEVRGRAVCDASAELAELPDRIRRPELVVYAIRSTVVRCAGSSAALGELCREVQGGFPGGDSAIRARAGTREEFRFRRCTSARLEMLGELFALERGAEIFT